MNEVLYTMRRSIYFLVWLPPHLLYNDTSFILISLRSVNYVIIHLGEKRGNITDNQHSTLNVTTALTFLIGFSSRSSMSMDPSLPVCLSVCLSRFFPRN